MTAAEQRKAQRAVHLATGLAIVALPTLLIMTWAASDQATEVIVCPVR
jgi:hypothetical protein